MSALPAGTVTFLFADVEGSTRLLQSLGERYGGVVGDFRRIMRERLGEAGGQEIDTQGDSFFFSFPRAQDAATGAVAAQQALSAHEWPEGGALRVRMGLHTGEPYVGEEGYHGVDVVRTARICAAAHGGQVLLSETTRALLGNRLPDGARLDDLGDHELKDVGRERLYQLSAAGAPDRFPALQTQRPSSLPGPGGRANDLAAAARSAIDEQVAREIEQAFGEAFGQERPKPPKRSRMHPAAAAALVLVAIALVVLVLRLTS